MSIMLASGMSIGCGAAANRAAVPAFNLEKNQLRADRHGHHRDRERASEKLTLA
jgi:hypothetical protein